MTPPWRPADRGARQVTHLFLFNAMAPLQPPRARRGGGRRLERAGVHGGAHLPTGCTSTPAVVRAAFKLFG